VATCKELREKRASSHIIVSLSQGSGCEVKYSTKTLGVVNLHLIQTYTMASMNASLLNYTTTFDCDQLEFCVHYRESSFYIETVVTTLTVIDVFLIVGTLAINGIFIVSFMYDNLRNSSNYLVLNLAVIDFTFGSIGLAACCIFQLQYIGCQLTLCYYKDLYVHFFGTGMVLTMMTFTFISIERYVCIFYALRWMAIITKKNIGIAICILWVYAIGMTTLCRVLDTWDTYGEIYFVQFTINIIIIVFTNVRIFQEIRRHEKRINLEQIAANAEEIRKAREKKRAKTISLMILLMILCYLPALLIMAAKRIPSVDPIQLQYGWMTCRTISLSHSMFDFLVYGLQTEEIRCVFRKILRMCWCGKKEQNLSDRQIQPSVLEITTNSKQQQQ